MASFRHDLANVTNDASLREFVAGVRSSAAQLQPSRGSRIGGIALQLRPSKHSAVRSTMPIFVAPPATTTRKPSKPSRGEPSVPPPASCTQQAPKFSRGSSISGCSAQPLPSWPPRRDGHHDSTVRSTGWFFSRPPGYTAPPSASTLPSGKATAWQLRRLVAACAWDAVLYEFARHLAARRTEAMTKAAKG